MRNRNEPHWRLWYLVELPGSAKIATTSTTAAIAAAVRAAAALATAALAAAALAAAALATAALALAAAALALAATALALALRLHINRRLVGGWTRSVPVSRRRSRKHQIGRAHV